MFAYFGEMVLGENISLVSRVGLLLGCLSFIFMILGHLGADEFNMVEFQISTYAAKAPYDFFITTSILLSSLTLLIISFLNSKYKLFGTSYLANFIPGLAGIAASGLIMLSYFEETAVNLKTLQQSNFMAIREQSFHDAGLLVFFYSSLLLVSLVGALTIIHNVKKINKLLGIVVLFMAPASFMLMTTRWPAFIGFEGIAVGLNQRAALLCLWLAFIVVLVQSSSATRSNTIKLSIKS